MTVWDSGVIRDSGLNENSVIWDSRAILEFWFSDESEHNFQMVLGTQYNFAKSNLISPII